MIIATTATLMFIKFVSVSTRRLFFVLVILTSNLLHFRYKQTTHIFKIQLKVNYAWDKMQLYCSFISLLSLATLQKHHQCYFRQEVQSLPKMALFCCEKEIPLNFDAVQVLMLSLSKVKIYV